MNIDKIRNAYDPEFDISYSDHSPPVTWVEMEIAEEVEKLGWRLNHIANCQLGLIEHITKLMEENEKLKLALGDTDE